MKKTLLLCLTLITATYCFAQQQLATLNHNDSISVYYGSTALQQAYSAAVDSDIITLSSGTFASVDIGKAVTIRGAGMYVDTVAGTSPTIISGDFTISHSDGTLSNHIRLEGMHFINNLNFRTTNYPEFTKCEFDVVQGLSITRNGQTFNMTNATFINCIIKNLQIVKRYAYYSYYTYREYTYIRNSVFINSAVMNTFYYDDNTSSGSTYYVSNATVSATGTNNSFTNCIVRLHPAEAQYYSTNNCILYYDVADSSNSSVTYNSIGINYDSNSANYFNSSILNGQNLHNYNSLSSVFKTFTGTYTSGGTSFELQDSIASSILGTDNTQVGIYGGSMPFDPYVRHPLVRRCNVASRSTADGKLAVDIEIVSE